MGVKQLQKVAQVLKGASYHSVGGLLKSNLFKAAGRRNKQSRGCNITALTEDEMF